MYESLNKFIGSTGDVEVSNIDTFLTGEGSLKEISLRLQHALNIKKQLINHRSKKSFTDKWKKKEDALLGDFTCRLAQIFIFVNSAHSYQVSFMNILLRAINHEDNGVLVGVRDASNNYYDLLCKLHFLDSTDRDTIGKFNKIRNVFFHVDTSYVSRFFDDGFKEEFIFLIQSIDAINTSIRSRYKDSIVCVVANDVKIAKNRACK